MDIGDTWTLRALQQALLSASHEIEHVRGRITSAVHGLHAGADVYERRAVAVFDSRWSEVSGLLRKAAAAAQDLASASGLLAGELERAHGSWTAALAEARAAGCSVQGAGMSTVVLPAPQSPPAPATSSDPASVAAAQAAAHAADVAARAAAAHADGLQQRMRDAELAALTARGRMRRTVATVPTTHLAVLGRPVPVSVSTGDPALDDETRHAAGALLAVHRTSSRAA